MQAVTDLGSTVGIEAACDALGVARASFYRQPPVLGARLTSGRTRNRARVTQR